MKARDAAVELVKKQKRAEKAMVKVLEALRDKYTTKPLSWCLLSCV
jgi:hypothetical protein